MAKNNGSSSNSREDLFAMLQELIRILDLVIYQEAAPLPQDLQQPIRAAWDDFHERHRNSIFVAIEQAAEFDKDLTASDREQGRLSLEGVGLTGPQLRVKFIGFWAASRRYIVRKGLKELQNLLGWGDIWLESLTKVIQVSEILVELKQVIEKALDMSDEE